MDNANFGHKERKINVFDADQIQLDGMPLPTEEQKNNLGRAGVEAISNSQKNEGQSDNTFEITEVDPRNDVNLSDSSSKDQSASDRVIEYHREFSSSDSFSKDDEKLTGKLIHDLESGDVRKAYKEVNEARREYIQASFKREIGE